MFSLEHFLGKFKNNAAYEILNRTIVSEVIQKYTGIFIEIKDMSFINGIIKLNISSIKKNEIYIKKNEIISSINSKISKLNIRHIQ